MAETKTPPNITLTGVTSSLIHSIGHDPASNTLAVRFLSKGKPGKLYHYPNFTAEQFEKFKGAESIGKHFGAHIRPLKDFTPIEEKITKAGG